MIIVAEGKSKNYATSGGSKSFGYNSMKSIMLYLTSSKLYRHGLPKIYYSFHGGVRKIRQEHFGSATSRCIGNYRWHRFFVVLRHRITLKVMSYSSYLCKLRATSLVVPLSSFMLGPVL